MIRSVKGVLAAADADGVVVEVGGVGLLVHVSAQTLGRLPELGEVVALDTHLAVREDALDLYGFATGDERELFQAFVGVSGVGPRLALALCGLDRPDALRHAIAVGDAAHLQRAPGVGKRTAERLVVELRDRVGALGGVTGVAERGKGPAAAPGGGAIGAMADAREGLIALGFGLDEAAHALRDAPDDLDAAALIRHGLTRLRRG